MGMNGFQYWQMYPQIILEVCVQKCTEMHIITHIETVSGSVRGTQQQVYLNSSEEEEEEWQ